MARATSDSGGSVALAEARSLAEAMPALLVEARRISATILAGWHGRRRAGPGEAFWQFRPFTSGEPSAMIDWRRSARDEHLYVREREWEAAHTIWLVPDLSASMRFRSRLAPVDKQSRAALLTLALAELLARGGERVGLLAGGPPTLSRNAAERIAHDLLDAADRPLDFNRVGRFSEVVLAGDFLDPEEDIEAQLDTIASSGARAHLVQVFDPAEETFPYSGRTQFTDPESGYRHLVGRAESVADAYRERLAARRDRLNERCRRLGWTFLIHRTDRTPLEPLLQLHGRLAERGGVAPSPGRAA